MMYVVVLLNSLVYLTNCIGIEVEIGLLVMLLLQFTLFVGVCWRVLCLAIVGRDLTFLKRKKEREEGENHYNLSIVTTDMAQGMSTRAGSFTSVQMSKVQWQYLKVQSVTVIGSFMLFYHTILGRIHSSHSSLCLQFDYSLCSY
jgi:hypothetical protein